LPSSDSDDNSLELFPDWKELLALFNAHGADYAVIGGIAVCFHGHVRATSDMDILVVPEPENAQRVMAALSEFGFGDVGLTAQDFQQVGGFVVLGNPPARIDLLTDMPGPSTEQVIAGRVRADFDGVPAWFISRDDLIAAKRAAGRHIDLADVESLAPDGS